MNQDSHIYFLTFVIKLHQLGRQDNYILTVLNALLVPTCNFHDNIRTRLTNCKSLAFNHDTRKLIACRTISTDMFIRAHNKYINGQDNDKIIQHIYEGGGSPCITFKLTNLVSNHILPLFFFI